MSTTTPPSTPDHDNAPTTSPLEEDNNKEDVGIPFRLEPTEYDVLEEMSLLDSFREEMRERQRNKQFE